MVQIPGKDILLSSPQKSDVKLHGRFSHFLIWMFTLISLNFFKIIVDLQCLSISAVQESEPATHTHTHTHFFLTHINTHTHTHIYIFTHTVFFSHYPPSCSITSDYSSLCLTAGSHCLSAFHFCRNLRQPLNRIGRQGHQKCPRAPGRWTEDLTVSTASGLTTWLL